jgi:hypothetical protein
VKLLLSEEQIGAGVAQLGGELDYQDAYRHLPYLAILEAEDLAAGPPR